MSALSPLSGVMRKSHFRAAKPVFDRGEIPTRSKPMGLASAQS
jgi:hypothetical protein